ncbi:MAG: ABC transporter ATP-binding protein [Pseudomonadota bacterium]
MSRRFGERAAVDAVSLSVAAGEVLCLLGPSGCGKSTTLRMVAGVERVDAGEIRVDGVPVAGPLGEVPAEERGVGLMFQDFALFPHLKVGDNVGYGLTGPRKERRARVDALLERVGLAQYRDVYPHVLSGGEQQRVALARALAPRPGVMLMDEPFSGLDERLRDEVRDDTLAVLREEGAAVLLVTHDPVEAMRMGDEIALMRGGRIVQRGTPQALYSMPTDAKTAAFFSDVNVLKGVVENGEVVTPLCSVPADMLTEGAQAQVLLRPQHIRLGAGAQGKVTKTRFLGLFTLVTVELETGESVDLHATIAPPQPGEAVRVMARPEDALVFSA